MSYIDQQNRAPKVEYLPDTRLRITREYTLLDYADKSPTQIAASVFISWNTADSVYTNCRLIKQDVTGQLGQGDQAPTKDAPTLIRIYEQISATGETLVGNPSVEIGPTSGLTVITQEFVQFSGQTPIYGVPGVTTAPNPWSAYLLTTDTRTDDGTLQRIKRKYINSRVISTDIEYLRSVDEGTTGVTKTTIKYISGMAVASNPITPPSGTATLESGYQDQDGFRIWTGIYAKGTGVVESYIEYKNKGLLVIYSITSLGTPPTEPSPTIGGTVVLIRSSQRNSPRLEEGAIVYDYLWAEGLGIIEDTVVSLQDGLREETYVSLGVISTPTGVVIRSTTEQIEGCTKYTVTCKQSANGGNPTSETFNFQRYCPFTYPGVLKTFIQTGGSGQRYLDVFKSPPIQTDVLSTVTISYQTSDTIPSLPNTLWQPLNGATISGQWVGYNFIAANVVESWRDYRAYSSTPIAITSSSFAPNDSIFGNLAYGGTVATAQVNGGPPDPQGLTWTILPPVLDLAFQDVNGTQYYRLTIITAAIPNQPALPV